jgi:hypothetical protein
VGHAWSGNRILVGCLLADRGLGTGDSHFISTDFQLNIERAVRLS